jgi:uncharacterized membrane protein
MDETQQPSMNVRPDRARNATTRVVLVGVGVLALVLVLGPLLFMAMMMLGMGGRMGGMIGQSGPMTWTGVLVAVSWLLVVAGIVLLLIRGIRRIGSRGMGAAEEPPLTIVQRRYARGEIGPEEYERIQADLLRDEGNQ